MRRIILALCALVSCGGAANGPGTSSATSAQTGSSSEPCWPVAPMRLLVLEHGTEWAPLAEMQGDGSIYSLKKGRKFVARVSKDQFLDAHDVPTMSCVHRQIYVPGMQSTARYGDYNEYIDQGIRIIVDDDGTVHLIAGRVSAGGVSLRVEGPVMTTRRTVALLVLSVLMAP